MKITKVKVSKGLNVDIIFNHFNNLHVYKHRFLEKRIYESKFH